MRARWAAAPVWSKVASILGLAWFGVLVVTGVPLLFAEGPGLPLIWLGMLGLVPGLLVALRPIAD